MCACRSTLGGPKAGLITSVGLRSSAFVPCLSWLAPMTTAWGAAPAASSSVRMSSTEISGTSPGTISTVVAPNLMAAATPAATAAATAVELTVIVNTGDDVTLHGLRISPDVDTVLYALSGIVDEKRGWGPRGDTFLAMEALERLGGETWFRLGDKDLASHIRRTELLGAGWPPSRITREFAQRLGIAGVTILPMTDAPVETWVQLANDGRWVHF